MRSRVVITGWDASGSTCVYQIAKALGLEAVKSHSLPRARRRDFTIFCYRDPRDIIVSNARRVHREMWQSEGPEAALGRALDDFLHNDYVAALYRSAEMAKVFFMRYETYFSENRGVLIDMIADNFLLPLTRERRAQILADTSLESNIARSQKLSGFQTWCADSLIHGHHISNFGVSGAWKECFTPAIERRVKACLDGVIIDLGYERTPDWSAGRPGESAPC